MLLRSLEGEEELGGCSQPSPPVAASAGEVKAASVLVFLAGAARCQGVCVGGVLCVVGGRVTGWAGSPGFDSARQS